MNKKHFALLVIVSVVSGLVGSAISILLLMPPSVLAQDEPQKVIEAEEFRVVDDQGNVRARLFMKEIALRKEPYLEIYGDNKKHEMSLSSSSFRFSLDNWSRVKLDLYDGEPLLTFRHRRTTHSRVMLGFWPNRNEPSLSLYDEVGILRAVLGTTELKNNRTGSTEIRAPSSLVLFDEEGKVVWSAP